ncbi:MAG: uracil-DNA glycosylase [Erysipelotrichaceae bacterium]|nr:uracil-DNA glycosylase [Erysipelotrichaceae bacterium]MBQ7888256.1 uracil-DNA glycosylase [Erysipelotrichaceae bacterium]
MNECVWKDFLQSEFQKDYFKSLSAFLKEEYRTKTIYPAREDVFNAFEYTAYETCKVVILGQDPYHEPNQAHGLCFSVRKGVDIPPSLRNIYAELHADLGCSIPTHGCLTDWALQGVFLLNTTMTVRKGAAASHVGKGWEIFTDHTIMKLNEKKEPLVFILWGSNARSKKKLITSPQHLIIESAHPSPLSCYRGFNGSRPFSRCNDYLMKHGIAPVNWQIRG